MNTQRLMAVMAHPDDETFGVGGTLALYARRGAEVRLVCATRGEVGSAPPDRKGFPSVGAMREAELRCAAEVLGLTDVHFLGYRDSGMRGSQDNLHPQALAAAPLAAVAGEVARYFRIFRPQVVITFDRIGGYGHPDHIAAHRATVEAFRLAGDPAFPLDGLAPYEPQKLYFQTFSRGFLRPAVRLLQLIGQDPSHFGQNKDIDLKAVAEVDFPVHAKVNIRSVLAVKERASACHASQGGGMQTGPLRWFFRVFGGSESYMRAFPETPPRRTERDLFAGVDTGR
jgi:LmbE family N-acetylglucosaminyl deacetylase